MIIKPRTSILRACVVYTIAGLATLATSSAGPARAQDAARADTMIVLDASGSMWGRVDGREKILIAREAFADIAKSLSSRGISTGLIAYGHRRKGDCSDIETIALPGEMNLDAIAKRVNGLTPKGKTPLSDAVRIAAEELRFTERKATVVLLSDGVETCSADPCAVASDLERLGIDFTAHVIGFDIKSEADKAQLACLAENTGGKYLDAENSAGLDAAINEAVENVAASNKPVAKPAAQTADLILRLQLPSGISPPAETTIFSDEQEIGRLSAADVVVPGLAVTLPVGPVTLRAEAPGYAGSRTFDIAANTEVLDIGLSQAGDGYIVWPSGPYPLVND
ncbi:VWA domain-containing protein, partial [Rhizobiaceae bacterium]|nr:VWA domain-containing protein [Rhizobiaceae bacterium]